MKRDLERNAAIREREGERHHRLDKKTTRRISGALVRSEREKRGFFLALLWGKRKEKDKKGARALSRLTHLDVRALQSDHGHGRTTDVPGADAANLNQRERKREVSECIYQQKPRWLKNKTPRPISTKGSLFRRDDEERGKRRTTLKKEEKRERMREKGEREFVLLVILTIVFFSLLCSCGVANACVACVCKDEEKKNREPQKNLRGHETKKTKKRHKRINTREREREKTRDVYRRLFVVGSDFERGFVLL